MVLNRNLFVYVDDGSDGSVPIFKTRGASDNNKGSRNCCTVKATAVRDILNAIPLRQPLRLDVRIFMTNLSVPIRNDRANTNLKKIFHGLFREGCGGPPIRRHFFYRRAVANCQIEYENTHVRQF